MLTREAGENPLPLRRVERRQSLLDRLVGRLVRSRPRPGVEFLRAGPVAREVERELEELFCRLHAQSGQIAERVDAAATLDLAAGAARASVVAPELHVGVTYARVRTASRIESRHFRSARSAAVRTPESRRNAR